MKMKRHYKLVYDNSTLCHICNEELGKDRVREHCHLSGKFRGAAHEVCNLDSKVFPTCISQFVYDSHLYIKHWEIAKKKFLVYQIMRKTTFLSKIGHR